MLKRSRTSLDPPGNYRPFVKSDAEEGSGDNDSLPWDIQDTLDVFIKEVSESRKINGKKWLEKFEARENDIHSMTVKEDRENTRRSSEAIREMEGYCHYLRAQRLEINKRISRRIPQRQVARV